MKIRPDAGMVGQEMFPFCDRIDKEGYRKPRSTGSIGPGALPVGDATPSGEHDAGALRMGTKMAYECETMPDGLAFRKATNARPSSPVPSKSRLLGSGVGAGSPMKV